MDTLTEQEVRAFVGPRADTYLKKWRAPLEGSGSGTGFNWAAFLLSGLWLPYRKMYLATTILFGIILIEAIAEEVVFVGILKMDDPPASLGPLVGILVGVVCGAFGNRWYLTHAQKAVAAVREQGLSEDAYLQALSKRGGTNALAALGFLLLFFGVTALCLVVLDSMFAIGG
jgi:uncharacterized protein DUF2628